MVTVTTVLHGERSDAAWIEDARRHRSDTLGGTTREVKEAMIGASAEAPSGGPTRHTSGRAIHWARRIPSTPSGRPVPMSMRAAVHECTKDMIGLPLVSRDSSTRHGLACLFGPRPRHCCAAATVRRSTEARSRCGGGIHDHSDSKSPRRSDDLSQGRALLCSGCDLWQGSDVSRLGTTRDYSWLLGWAVASVIGLSAYSVLAFTADRRGFMWMLLPLNGFIPFGLGCYLVVAVVCWASVTGSESACFSEPQPSSLSATASYLPSCVDPVRGGLRGQSTPADDRYAGGPSRFGPAFQTGATICSRRRRCDHQPPRLTPKRWPDRTQRLGWEASCLHAMWS